MALSVTGSSTHYLGSHVLGVMSRGGTYLRAQYLENEVEIRQMQSASTSPFLSIPALFLVPLKGPQPQ